MSYANPNYNADWEAVHDYHAPQREKAFREKDRLASTGQMMTEAYKVAEAAFARHHQACLDAIISQFATVQDYANWLSKSWSVPYGYDSSIPLPHVDIEGLCTMKEASDAFSQASRELQDAVNTKRHECLVGQPEGVKAFADANSGSLKRYWREFLPSDLYPQGYAGILGVRTFVTVDECEDGWHVCFMQDWKTRGVSVTNTIDRLATAFFLEAKGNAEMHSQHAGQKGLWAWFARWSKRKHVHFLDPDRFHFYEYIPPTPDVMENFCRVILTFKNGEYRDPKWLHFKSVPEVIKTGPGDLEMHEKSLKETENKETTEPISIGADKEQYLTARLELSGENTNRSIIFDEFGILIINGWTVAITHQDMKSYLHLYFSADRMAHLEADRGFHKDMKSENQFLRNGVLNHKGAKMAFGEEEIEIVINWLSEQYGTDDF